MKKLLNFLSLRNMALLCLFLGFSSLLEAQPTAGKVYQITNANYTGYSLSESSGKMIAEATATDFTTDESNYDQLWLLESGTSTDGFYLKNALTAKYVTFADGFSVQWTTKSSGDEFIVANVSGTSNYTFTSSGTSWYGCMHCAGDKNIVRWEDAAASQWTLTEISAVTEQTLSDYWQNMDPSAERDALASAMNDVAEKIDDIISYTPLKNSISLQTTDEAADGYLSTNAQETSEGPIADLLDNNTSKFFHSTWTAGISENPYLQVDLGDGKSLQNFVFSYTTRSNGGARPNNIVIYGSTDGTTFVKYAEINSGLPTGAAAVYTSNTIFCPARYIRFEVTASTSSNGSYPCFAMSEFSLSEVVYPVSKISLQTTDDAAGGYLSTNAQETSEGPIEDLLDGSTDTYFHSAWSSDLDTYPYLQVDLGESVTLSQFVFAYTTRDNGSVCPTDIIIYGSNDNSTYTQITELNSNLPTTAAGSYVSDIISCTTAFRYLRFEVRSNNTGDTDGSGNYPCFALSTFSLYKIIPTDFAINSSYRPSHVLKLILGLLDALDTYAATYADNLSKASAFSAATTSLNALSASVIVYPFEITTDITNPYLYVIYSGRGGSLCYTLQSDNSVKLTEFAIGNSAQLWYFTLNSDMNLQIASYSNDSILASNDVNDGAAKVTAISTSKSGYTSLWTLVVSTSPYYAFQPIGFSTYLSNYGGTGNAMGFYNDIDEGTKVSFTHVKDILSEEFGIPTGVVGAYTTTAYSAAKTIFDDSSSADKDYASALNTLSTAERIVLEDSKFYVIENAASATYCKGAYMYVGKDDKMYWKAMTGTFDGSAVWSFTSNGTGYNMRNVYSNDYSTTSVGGNPSPMSTTAAPVTLTSLGLGQYNIIPSSGSSFHAQSTGSCVVGWNAGLNSASAWYLKEVDVFAQTVSISSVEFATFYVNYDVTVPSGVTAYYPTAIEGNSSYVHLNEVGSVIPAGSAVLLNGAEGSYDFTYSTTTGTSLTGNLMKGSAVDSYIEQSSNNTYYILGVVNEETAFYQPEFDSNETGATGTTHFLNNASKGYLDIPSSSPIRAMYFNWDDVTAVESLEKELENGKTEIFDISGRRVNSISAKGLYIVNGKKWFVK